MVPERIIKKNGERTPPCQMERQRVEEEAWIQREESIQAAMRADPNITREELEDQLDEADRINNDAR